MRKTFSLKTTTFSAYAIHLFKSFLLIAYDSSTGVTYQVHVIFRVFQPKVLVPWQVHGGKLHDGRRFAMKIQYPGVARSIESDVDNLMRLINIANLLPKGLYVEQAAEVRT